VGRLDWARHDPRHLFRPFSSPEGYVQDSQKLAVAKEWQRSVILSVLGEKENLGDGRSWFPLTRLRDLQRLDSVKHTDKHPGTKVVHQSPPGCISPEPDVDKPRLFDFETMAEYIIPRQAFCNRYVTICDPDNKYRILGHPVCIKDERYTRNEFMFNFCIVIGVEVDKSPYEAVVRRLASTFTEMEIQNQFLSQEDASNSQDRRSIAALIEIIKEDLNNYNECMIPVGKCPNHITSWASLTIIR
jgi:hypothetical protein